MVLTKEFICVVLLVRGVANDDVHTELGKWVTVLMEKGHFYCILFYNTTVFKIALCSILYIVPLLYMEGKAGFRALLNYGLSSRRKLFLWRVWGCNKEDRKVKSNGNPVLLDLQFGKWCLLQKNLEPQLCFLNEPYMFVALLWHLRFFFFSLSC